MISTESVAVLDNVVMRPMIEPSVSLVEAMVVLLIEGIDAITGEARRCGEVWIYLEVYRGGMFGVEGVGHPNTTPSHNYEKFQHAKNLLEISL